MSLNGKFLDKNGLTYLWSKLKTKFAAKQDAISDLASIRSGAAAGATAVQQTAFETDQQRQETEIGSLLDRDAKNIFDTTVIPQTATYNGVTITRTEKGLHISGTVKSTADTQIAHFALEIPGDDYHVYINTNAIALNVWCTYVKSGTSSDIYAPAVRDTLNTGYTLKYLYFKNLPGGTVFDVDVDIMVCTASDYDISSQFVPYAKTNRELTVAEDADRAALVAQVDGGAKNLLRNTASSQVVGGVTFTVNSDGTIIANGTKTNNDWFYLSTENSLAAGEYVLSSGLAPQSNMRLKLLITTADSLGSAIMSAEGERQVQIKQLTSDYTGLYYAIRISSGTTVNNIVFKPMLCTAEDYAISPAFVPYAPTNRELYETGQLCYDFIFGVGTALQNNDNLNDYKAPGKVFAANGAIAATIANAPWTQSGFTVFTIPNITLTSCMQFVLPNTMAGKWYRRRYMQGTWSPWTEYDGTQVATT